MTTSIKISRSRSIDDDTLTALAVLDSRIVAEPALRESGSRARVQRWLEAGQPTPDFVRLQFRGADWARQHVLQLLQRVPTPVAWHAVEFVVWREVGSKGGGWMGPALRPRDPDGDQGHEIMLTGRTDDESYESCAAHELGHSWSWPVCPHVGFRPNMAELEHNARHVLIAREIDLPIRDIVQGRVADERLANELATLWGYPRFTDEVALTARFTEMFASAATLADEIEVTAGDERPIGETNE